VHADNVALVDRVASSAEMSQVGISFSSFLRVRTGDAAMTAATFVVTNVGFRDMSF
jgi:hypothetical protein